MNKQTILSLFLCLVAYFLTAQPVNNEIGDVVLPAPNAAGLMKYGDHPVKFFTGTPQIAVDIHTLQEGSLSLPVSVSYHASGVKIAEASSWVGNSWSLIAGGQISRQVQNLPDENGNRNRGNGYYESAAANLQNLTSTTGKLEQASSGEIDTEPDLYNFNYPNGSGRFTLDVNGNPQLIPMQNLKIEIDYSNNLFHRFTIIEANGTKYHFGRSPNGNEDAYEYTYEGLNIENFYPSTWYLVKVESHDGLNTINLTYVDENYSYHQPASCQFIGVAQLCLGGTGGEGGISCSSSGSLNIRNNATYDYLRMNVRGKRLSTITTSTETLSFIAGNIRQDLDANTAQGGNNARSLEAIELSTGTFCKKYNFFYDYFADEELTDAYALRLKLDSIREETWTGISPAEIIPPHVFTYDAPVYSNNGHSNDGRQILPHRLSKAIDYWGYANGSTVNETKRLNVPDMEIVRSNGNINFDGGGK